MNKIIKLRWVLLIIWVAAALILTVIQPDLKKVIDEKGNPTVTEKYPSKIAETLLNGMSDSKGESTLIVFNNEKKLTSADMNEIQAGLKILEDNKKELGITNILSPFNTPEAKDRLTSEDGTTILTSVTIEKNGRDAQEISSQFEDRLKNLKVDHYLTGGLFVQKDFLKATYKGVDRSAIITVLFILIVLFLVFKSITTPLISLLTVGIAYLCSMGIVGQLVNAVNFSVTSLTQMFMILVLFGIGTDYNILLFNRFKEELGRNESVNSAIIATYKTAGKTILYSGLTVFIAFASLSFVQFGVYRSGNAVAIGIVVLFLELVTLTPFFMKLLGPKLFWPSHETKGHRESRLWEKVTSATVKHPIISTLALIAVIAPIIIFSSSNLSYDNMKDMGSSYPSVEGFNIVSKHFNRGTTMPTTVVIKNITPMDNNTALSVIDKLTEDLKGVKGVKAVSGPTQPEGSKIKDLYTDSSLKRISDGLSQSKSQFGGGSFDLSGIEKLANGTGNLHNGLIQLSGGLKQLQDAINSSAGGSEKISQSIGLISSQMTTISNSVSALNAGYSQLSAGYSQLQSQYSNIEKQIGSSFQAFDAMKGYTSKLGKDYPQMSGDSTYLSLNQTIATLSGQLEQLKYGLSQLNANFDKANTQLVKANENMKLIADGERQMADGLSKLQAGTQQLSGGLSQVGNGQSQIVNNMQPLIDGAAQIEDGQRKLSSGLSKLTAGMPSLQSSIGDTSGGVSAISDQLSQATSYLSDLAETKSFFIPKAALQSSDFKKSLDAFMSADRKTVKLIVILNDDPYSSEAIKTVKRINNIVESDLKGSALSQAIYGTGGESSVSNDTNIISTRDMTVTQIIVFLSVFILLILVIRSFWIPVYIIIALAASYYTAISITGFVTSSLFKADGIAWNVPFFSFIMIVALGVDYSIFLMTRYKEYGSIPPQKAIVSAAKNIGGVVVSAAIILAGTFATLFPSGLHTLMEMAVSVGVGLLMLSLLMLPVFIPSMISMPQTISKMFSRKSKVTLDQ